jgi:hypothetical protein
MHSKVVDISHRLLTNNFFIIGGAFALFIVMNAVLGLWQTEPMSIGTVWI